MANFFPIQTNFGGGILSPRLWARTDTPVYPKSLESCENWTVYPQGSLHRRGGMGYAADSLATDTYPYVRLIEMPSRTKAYVLELTRGKLRIFDNNGLVVIGVPQIIENNQFARGLAAWVNLTGNEAANPQVKAVSLTSLGSNQGQVEQNLARRGMLKPATSYTMTFSLAGVFGNTDVQVTFYDGTTGTAIAGGSFSYITLGAKTLTITTPATLPVGGLFLRVRNVKQNSSVLFTEPIMRETTATPTTEFVTPWLTEAQIAAIQVSYSSATDETFFANQFDPPQHLIHPDINTDNFAFSAVTFVAQPPEWSVGNYPGSVEVYQGRLWFAGSTNEPNMVWASKTNDLYNFTLGAQDKADDALSFRVATKGGIQWLKSQRTMLAGTVLGEYVIQGTNGGPVTPQSIDIRQQSAFGSARIQPYNVADQVVYVSLDRAKVRAANFELVTGGWNSSDLTFMSPEITASPVKEITFARDPLELILCTLDDGTMAVCTYHKASDTVAWQKVATNGKIMTAAVSFYTRGSIWAVVQRTNPGASTHQYFIEKIALDTSTLFSDCGGTYPIDDFGEVTGLTRLNGWTVDITVGDVATGFAVVPRQQVTNGKVVGLDPAIPLANIGIPYLSKAITLPLEGGNPGGSAQGVMKGRDRIFTRIFNSALPLINGYRVQDDRTPAQPMNTPEAPRTGDALLASLGVDRYAKVTIEQDLPAATKISGIFGRSQVNAL